MRIIGIDIGGTFTDFVLLDGEQLLIHKRLSTPRHPAQALLEGVGALGGAAALVHGSTVATNALLERRGAPTALVTTSGFADVLAIGRGARPELYDLNVAQPPPLVPRDWRLELGERLLPGGEVLQPLHEDELAALVARIAELPVEAVAICLLHAYANGAHERRVLDALDQALPGLFVSASHQVLPAFREYERTSTTVVNAYVAPLMARYLRELEQSLAGAASSLRIVGSDGGSMSAATAAALPARTALSGPAAGVVGARYVASLAGYERIITFDMGGTSTDVALCPGALPLSANSQVGGLPIALPSIDIHTVGAGGGSLARLDPGGALRVGPQSAGALPGPACYGQGTQATVTDANVVLGRLPSDQPLGGSLRLDRARAEAALLALAGPLGLSVEELALGIVTIANAAMERAIRTISVERGDDPRSCTLVAFGGAGPLHALALAQALAIPRVLVPRYPGVLSALGMLAADATHELFASVLQPWAELDSAALLGRAAELARSATASLSAEGFPAVRQRLEWSLDLRYRGQGYELAVPLDAPALSLPQPDQLLVAAERFHELHERRYGHALRWRPLELVGLRCRASGLARPPSLLPNLAKLPATPSEAGSPALPAPQPLALRQARLDEQPGCAVPIFERDQLLPGQQLAGPAVIVQLDATTVVPHGWRLSVDQWLNLLLERNE